MAFLTGEGDKNARKDVLSGQKDKISPAKPCRPRYNLHLYGQVGRLWGALSLPTSSRKQQPGGLRTTNQTSIPYNEMWVKKRPITNPAGYKTYLLKSLLYYYHIFALDARGKVIPRPLRQKALP